VANPRLGDVEIWVLENSSNGVLLSLLDPRAATGAQLLVVAAAALWALRLTVRLP
jgi:hypothetical protein